MAETGSRIDPNGPGVGDTNSYAGGGSGGPDGHGDPQGDLGAGAGLGGGGDMGGQTPSAHAPGGPRDPEAA